MDAWRSWLPPLLLVLCAAVHARFVLFARAGQELGVAAVDTLAYFVPNTLYAWRSVLEGSGLLWNPFQSCGQPFLAISSAGVLYPPQLLFLWLDVDAALQATVVLHLGLAGIGAYGLARALRLDPPAALGAAAAFAFGTQCLKLASWSPIHLAAFAWLPLVLWRAERALVEPGPRNGAWLALVVALQILPGFPQLVFLGGQLVLLRTVFVLLRGGKGVRLLPLACVASGLGLGVLLAAVQLLPAVELVGESVRSGGLSRGEIGEGLDWASAFPRSLHWPYPLSLPLVVALCAIGPLRPETRAPALFFLSVAALYLALGFGPGSPVFDLYALLPLAGSFRHPDRFLWCVDLALALAAGFGAQALLLLRHRAIGVLAAALVGALVFLLASRVGDLDFERPVVLEALQWLLAVVGLAVVAVCALLPPRARFASLSLPVLLLAAGFASGSRPYLGQRTGVDYGVHEASFARVREALTPQDRAFLVGSVRNFGLMPKSASLLRVPSIGDFEPQTSLAWARYTTFMQTGRAFRRVDQAYTMSAQRLVTDGFRRPLLDLTAARFVLAERRMEPSLAAELPDLQLRHRERSVTVYENPKAHPRAFLVPRVRVLPGEEILPALAGGEDPRAAALVTALPASGYAGAPGGGGTARIARDLAEHVVVEVDSAQRGFLFLADQHAPGWRALVDGRETEILRANHAFRLVEVPAGRSRVEFRYRPTSLYAGAALSAAGAFAWAGLLWAGRRR